MHYLVSSLISQATQFFRGCDPFNLGFDEETSFFCKSQTMKQPLPTAGFNKDLVLGVVGVGAVIIGSAVLWKFWSNRPDHDDHGK